MKNRILLLKSAACVTATVLGILIFGSIADASIVTGDVIAIDFGATATSTANYNISTNASTAVADLIRLSDGAATGVSLAVVGSTQDNASGIASTAGLGNTTDADIFVDGILANLNFGAGSGNGPTALTLTFNNLDPSLTYDLVGGTARPATQNNPQNFEANFSVPGAATQFSNGQADLGYVSFTGLAAPGGTLVLTIDGTNNFSTISQLELTAVAVVPEPSSMAIVGLGGLALILPRRRRS